MDLKLKAQQINLDQLLTAKDAPAPMQRLTDAAENAASAPAVTLFDLPLLARSRRADADPWRRCVERCCGERFGGGAAKRYRAPFRERSGGAHLALDGALETGSAPVFKGHVVAGADDISRFRDWLNTNLPQFGLPDVPFQSAALEGTANISQVGAVGSDLVIHVDGSVLTGTLAYTRKIGIERARLFADLSAQRLELPRLPDLSILARRTSDFDLALRFDARSGEARRLRRWDARDRADRIRLRQNWRALTAQESLCQWLRRRECDRERSLECGRWRTGIAA